MSYQDKEPFIPQVPKEVNALLQGLESGTGKRSKKGSGGFSCKKTSFPIRGANNVTLDSWKFNDWDYKRDDLPTYARGLFTYRRQDGTPEIATRGYNKFFNVDEVNDTKWRNVEQNTRGPFELSVKENGCIIFVSGLEGDKLLVCSKHSTGVRADVNLSHAVAGEKWIDRHLASVGKTREALARELRQRNVTAVAELCDDSFEEHVLAYDEASAGLYLHGMNLNRPEFATYSGSMVHKFADDWGFKKAQFIIKDDIETTKKFLDQCSETGSWGGRDTEGFVIRCQKRAGGPSSPYEDWFFKYKFDEPYLMYRQWRECTKALINGKAPRFKKHQKITEEYLLYARRQLARTPGLAKAYNANHGIIKMRDGFLQERGIKGSEAAREEYADTGNSGSTKNATNNIILVPIATIGCGKTTVATALTRLFRWGHIQNDNITAQKNKPKQFAIQLCNKMAEYPVVIADRNNHQKRERKQIFEDVTRVVPETKYVALHYVHEHMTDVRKITRARVLERGDNHQTIHAGTKSPGEIISIMEGFLHRFEPLDPNADPDCNFDEVIDLNPAEDSRQNLDLVVNALHKAFPKVVTELPSAIELDDAISAAMNDYTVSLKHDLSFKPKPQKVEYFCIRLPAARIMSVLEDTFRGQEASVAGIYHQLQSTRRIQVNFHVTLMHRASIEQNRNLWSKLTASWEQAKSSQDNQTDPLLGNCRVQLERAVWDRRVMCIVARILDGWETSNVLAHITIGTSDPSIKPKESNILLEKWTKEGSSENGISELEIKGKPELAGEVRAVTAMTR